TGPDRTIEKAKVASLNVVPQGLNDFTYGNENAVAIPDNNARGIVSTIEGTDDVQIFVVPADVNISHTWIGDLRVVL
ncbi:hypothetical protein ODY75_20405, partial [Shewanella xiamenensis]|uniref:hypothetical protein n=1 Tax=Shewanella xiamenensis TaxID=332186 RepID=UPI0024A6A02C